MRIRLEHNRTTFEYERHPLPEGRFRTLCLLTAAGIYGGMVAAMTALCGVWGVVAVMVATLLAIGIASV